MRVRHKLPGLHTQLKRLSRRALNAGDLFINDLALLCIQVKAMITKPISAILHSYRWCIASVEQSFVVWLSARSVAGVQGSTFTSPSSEMTTSNVGIPFLAIKYRTAEL